MATNQTAILEVEDVSQSLSESLNNKLNDANAIVSEGFSNTTAWVNDLLEDLNQSITTLKDTLFVLTKSDLSIPGISHSDIDAFSKVLTLEPAYRKQREDPDNLTVTLTDPDLATKDVSSFTETPPTPDIPQKNWTRPGVPPTFNENVLKDIALPSTPSVNTVEPINKLKSLIGELNIPKKPPSFTPVTWEETKPVLDLKDFDPLTQKVFNFLETREDTAVTDKLVESILQSIIEGLGLSSGTENALWQRARDRIADEYEQAVENVNEQWAVAGWVIPSGAQFGALADVVNKRARALEQANYEIAIENARLVVQDRQNAMKIATEWEGIYRQYLSGYYQRMLEAATKYAEESWKILDAVIEYNKQIISIEALHSEIFKTRMQAAMTEIDAYRAEYEAYKLNSDIRNADIQACISWLNALMADVQIYEAQIRAQGLIVESNRSLVALYGERVGAYTGTVQSFAQEVQAWNTEVQAEYRKIEAFTAQVEGYKAYAGAIESQNRVELAKGDITIKNNEYLLQELKAKIDAFLALVQADSEYNKVEAGKMDALARGYSAEAGAFAEIQKAKASAKASEEGASSQRLQIELQKYSVDLETQKANLTFLFEKLSTITKVYAQLAAGLASSVNITAGIQNQLGFSWSTQYENRLGISNEYQYNDGVTK